jgi:hypothetical protein
MAKKKRRKKRLLDYIHGFGPPGRRVGCCSGDPAKRAGGGVRIGDYTADELELLRAVARFRSATGRVPTTASEVLSLVKGLGYRKAVRVTASGTTIAAEGSRDGGN